MEIADFTNVITTLGDLKPQVNDAIKNELLHEGLSKSGNLLNSVKTDIMQTGDGFQLQTTMLDYWQYLNDKYNFLDKAIQPIEGNIKDALLQAASKDLLNFMNQTTQH